MRKESIFLLPQTVAYHAEHLPDHQAYVFGNTSINYRALYTKVRQLSRLLVENGLKKGDRVGIWMHRSLETAIAVHGILHAGGVFVPLDPFAPMERIQFVLKDCDIHQLITHPQLRKSLEHVISINTSLSHIIGFEGDWPIPSFSWEDVYQHPELITPPYPLQEQDLAYIIYTSGSTGVPKGIMHSHYSGLSYARLSTDLYQVLPQDRVASHAQLHFDMSTFAYFSAPFAGATTVILPEAHTKMPASLSQLMEKEKISIWYSVPLALIQLLQRGVLEKRNLQSLRWILYGGEPFPAKPLRALMEYWPQARFCNVYGPAEVNQCTFYHIPEFPKEDQAIPLGEAWDNTEVLIVDEQNQCIHDQEVGELLVRSATRMMGYWNQAALTKRSWFMHERIPGIPETYYRTGDLVQRNDLGELMFMGRKDRQIKTRGYRVELSEVEIALMKHQDVSEAAAFAKKDQEGENQIHAQVILNPDAILQMEELLAFVAAQLPSYATPRTIYQVDNFPRTSAGKIDYHYLETIMV